MDRSVAHRIYDLTEEALSAENVSLRDDVESYSTIAKMALHHVAKLTTRNDHLQEQNRRVVVASVLTIRATRRTLSRNRSSANSAARFAFSGSPST